MRRTSAAIVIVIVIVMTGQTCAWGSDIPVAPAGREAFVPRMLSLLGLMERQECRSPMPHPPHTLLSPWHSHAFALPACISKRFLLFLRAYEAVFGLIILRCDIFLGDGAGKLYGERFYSLVAR